MIAARSLLVTLCGVLLATQPAAAAQRAYGPRRGPAPGASPVPAATSVVALGRAHPAARGSPRQEGGPVGDRLLRAQVRVRALEPSEAAVTARFRRAGSGPVALLLIDFPGQSLTELAVTVGGAPAEVARQDPPAGAVRRLTVARVPAGQELVVRYRVRLPGRYAYRFPLPVPDLQPEAAGAAVHLSVELPPGAEYRGDSFPRLVAADGNRLVADLVGVPGFVHVVFGAGPGVPAYRRIEALALAGAILPCLLALAWLARYRRARRAA